METLKRGDDSSSFSHTRFVALGCKDHGVLRGSRPGQDVRWFSEREPGLHCLDHHEQAAGISQSLLLILHLIRTSAPNLLLYLFLKLFSVALNSCFLAVSDSSSLLLLLTLPGSTLHLLTLFLCIFSAWVPLVGPASPRQSFSPWRWASRACLLFVPSAAARGQP